MTRWKRIPNTKEFEVIECDNLPSDVYRSITSGNLNMRETQYHEHQQERRDLRSSGVKILKCSKKII